MTVQQYPRCTRPEWSRSGAPLPALLCASPCRPVPIADLSRPLAPTNREGGQRRRSESPKSPSAASLVIFRIGVDRGHVFRLARRTGISSLNQAPVVLDIQENKTWLAALRDGHRMAEGLGDDISGLSAPVARQIA